MESYASYNHLIDTGCLALTKALLLRTLTLFLLIAPFSHLLIPSHSTHHISEHSLYSSSEHLFPTPLFLLLRAHTMLLLCRGLTSEHSPYSTFFPLTYSFFSEHTPCCFFALTSEYSSYSSSQSTDLVTSQLSKPLTVCITSQPPLFLISCRLFRVPHPH